MTWLALPWFVLITTGSPSRMTFVLAAEVIGLGIDGLPSGSCCSGSARAGRCCSRTLPRAADAAGAAAALDRRTLVRAAPDPRAAARGATAPYFAAQRVIVPGAARRGRDDGRAGERPHAGGAADDDAARAAARRGPDRRARPGAGARDRRGDIRRLVPARARVRPSRPGSPAAEESRGLLAGLRFLFHEPLLRVWGPLSSSATRRGRSSSPPCRC